ncbi:MAG: carboxypeptidase regulatory-like domain-containing protein, partial [Acidobacteriota bacterium]
MNKNFKFISMVLTIVFCFSAMAFGQGTTGSIEGYVKDNNDAIIPNAVVKVESNGSTTGYNRTVTADAGGYIRIPSIPPGTYQVMVSAPNFADRTSTVTVVVDKATTITTILDVAGSVANVEVQANNEAQIDPTSTKIDTNITKQVIDALPKGTNFTSLLKAAPNVRPEALSGGFQIDGASGSENVFVIDGQEVTNFRTGTLDGNNNVPFELVQEVQIKSTGFGAEYGGATG